MGIRWRWKGAAAGARFSSVGGGGIVYMCGGVGRGQGCGLLVLTTRRKGEQVNLVVEL